MKGIIRIGDKTTSGGTVLSDSSVMKFGGIGVAREGDPGDVSDSGTWSDGYRRGAGQWRAGRVSRALLRVLLHVDFVTASSGRELAMPVRLDQLPPLASRPARPRLWLWLAMLPLFLLAGVGLILVFGDQALQPHAVNFWGVAAATQTIQRGAGPQFIFSGDSSVEAGLWGTVLTPAPPLSK